MNIGIINKNYKEHIQEEKLLPLVDVLLYYDNSDIEGLHEQMKSGDSIYITSYAFLHDDPLVVAKFKAEIDDNKIAMYSILENTVGCIKTGRDFPFIIYSGAYTLYEFIKEHRK